MLCGNTKAEIDRDNDTHHAEQTRFIAEEARWIRAVNDLLGGKAVNGCTLSERMIDQHEAFADMANDDYDFMAKFKDGHLEHYRNLLTTEAKTLASVIMGR